MLDNENTTKTVKGLPKLVCQSATRVSGLHGLICFTAQGNIGSCVMNALLLIAKSGIPHVRRRPLHEGASVGSLGKR